MKRDALSTWTKDGRYLTSPSRRVTVWYERQGRETVWCWQVGERASNGVSTVGKQNLVVKAALRAEALTTRWAA